MKILLDPTIFTLQQYGGISRYFAELYHFLSKDKEVQIKLPLQISDNLHLKNYGYPKSLLGSNMQRYLPEKIKSHLKDKSYADTIKLLKSSNYALFLPTYYNHYFLNSLGNMPYVLTVYDMIHENYPDLEKGSSIIEDKKRLIINASQIISISEHTKSDILRFYPEVSAKKIHVVYLCHSIVKKQIKFSITRKLPTNRKYILFVGNRGYYKNFEWFLPVVSDWLKENNISLLCLGGGTFNEKEKKSIKEFGLTELVEQYTFQDEELYSFYNNALAFIFPSEYEGFGIPVLESMVSGCPVLLPRLTSFPEVAGEAAEYFDLSDAQTLVKSLTKINNNKDYRETLIKKGYDQAAKFSWTQTVNSCLEIYKLAIK